MEVAIKYNLAAMIDPVTVACDRASGVYPQLAPDLVILDVMLPNRSGFEILADLRAAPETAALPVLMLTARGRAKDREQAERMGASRFMTKPFSNAEVLEAVRDLVLQ